jgi:diguanylate cyclase (GGDEF)-like protein/hemerythrin-like metal-binding protein
MKKESILSAISLRVLTAVTVGTLAVLAIVFAGRLDEADALERYALFGVGAILVMTALAATVFFIRLGALNAILLRLDGLLERYFLDAPRPRPARTNDECAQISFALELLEESIAARDFSARQLRRQEQISASILRALHQSVVVADGRGIITLFSQGAEAMLGYSAEEMVGQQTPMLFHDAEEIRRRAEELSEELCIPVVADTYTLVAKALATGQVDEREWTYIRKDGTRLTVLSSITVFHDDQGEIMCCCVATDITERSQAALEMSRLANYDPLTQLPNRRLFHDRMRMAIFQARREGTSLGLLAIDLDRFKPVNDQYGHSVGDLLLCAVARRMQECLRESDTLARVGGDEFIIIISRLGSAEDAVGVANKIRQSLAQPFTLSGEITVRIDSSIGVAIYPDHGSDEESLQKSADDAMYIAKGLGRAQVHLAGGGSGGGRGLDEMPDRHDTALLVWRHSYRCGDPDIDREHKELFSHGNALIRAAAKERAPADKLLRMLQELIAALSEHCRHEEFLLARLGYADTAEHARKHGQLIDHARALCRRFDGGEPPVSDAISFVTREVVAQHILVNDHEYFSFLKEALRRESERAGS